MQFAGNRLDDVVAIYKSTYVPADTRDNDNMAWLRINNDVSTT